MLVIRRYVTESLNGFSWKFQPYWHRQGYFSLHQVVQDNLVLNAFRDRAATASLDSLFQYFMSLPQLAVWVHLIPHPPKISLFKSISLLFVHKSGLWEHVQELTEDEIDIVGQSSLDDCLVPPSQKATRVVFADVVPAVLDHHLALNVTLPPWGSAPWSS